MGSAVRLLTTVPAWVSSRKPMTVTREESLTSAIRKPMPGGTAMRIAWGRTT